MSIIRERVANARGWVLLLVLLLLTAGCGRQTGPATVVVHGTVTCGGENVELGEIRFVPIDGTPGSRSAGAIRDGQYRIDARGGVPAGRHRVEIVAKRRTGRQIMGDTGTETGLVDETVAVAPPHYAGEESPLVAEVSKSTARLDFDLPEQ